MSATKTIKEVQVVGGDKPDFVQEVFRGKQIYGYQLEYGESLFWEALLCVENPNPNMITARSPLAPGEEDYLKNPVTGADYTYIPAEYDALLKVTLCDFNQPVRLDVIVQELGNYPFSIGVFYPSEPSFYTSPIGTTKQEIVGAGNPMTFMIKIKNLGNDYAVGRVIVGGFIKKGAYTWR